MLIKIDDAPFTEEEKSEIKALGFHWADWGYPEVQLVNPVAYFKESRDSLDKLGEADIRPRWLDEPIDPTILKK